jgi:hypothetical protein
MPDCPYWAPIDPTLKSGVVESDLRSTESPDGRVKSLTGNSKTVLKGLRWDAVSSTVAYDLSATVTSFEKFWQTSQRGGVSYCSVGGFVYFYPNADSASNNRYKMVGIRNLELPQVVSGWAGRFRVELPRLVLG